MKLPVALWLAAAIFLHGSGAATLDERCFKFDPRRRVAQKYLEVQKSRGAGLVTSPHVCWAGCLAFYDHSTHAALQRVPGGYRCHCLADKEMKAETSEKDSFTTVHLIDLEDWQRDNCMRADDAIVRYNSLRWKYTRHDCPVKLKDFQLAKFETRGDVSVFECLALMNQMGFSIKQDLILEIKASTCNVYAYTNCHAYVDMGTDTPKYFQLLLPYQPHTQRAQIWNFFLRLEKNPISKVDEIDMQVADGQKTDVQAKRTRESGNDKQTVETTAPIPTLILPTMKPDPAPVIYHTAPPSSESSLSSAASSPHTFSGRATTSRWRTLPPTTERVALIKTLPEQVGVTLAVCAATLPVIAAAIATGVVYVSMQLTPQCDLISGHDPDLGYGLAEPLQFLHVTLSYPMTLALALLSLLIIVTR